MKFVVALLAVLAVGLGIHWFANSRGEREPGVPVGEPDSNARNRSESTSNPDRTASDVESREPTRNVVDPGAPRRDLPQGLRGRVVGPEGAALANAEIELLEGIAHNPFDLLVVAERGVIVPPIARAISGPDGRFEVGASKVIGRGYSLRVRAAGHAAAVLPQLTIFGDRWTELGDIRLERGLVLRGRVTVQGSDGFPLAGAIVTARPVGLTSLTTPTAESEDGASAVCDAGGEYAIADLPEGPVQVVARAPGFARVVRPVVELRVAVDNRCNFELPRGATIVGSVRSTTGAPLAGATIEARVLVNRSTMAHRAFADADGNFEIIGLEEGAFLVTAVANGHVPTERKPIRAGARDVVLELSPQPRLRVKVERSGEVLRNFDLLVLAAQPDSEVLRSHPGSQVARVLPIDLDADGYFDYGGIDPGHYVVQVEATGIAKSFSAPFAITLESPETRVQVDALRGGSIRLVVADARGRPLSEAQVTTIAEFVDDNPITRMLSEAVPMRITQRTASSERNGAVQLDTLSPGRYRLRIGHPDATEVVLDPVELSEGGALDLGTIRLPAGAVVRGVTTVDGAPASQVKVSLVAVESDGSVRQPQVLAEATSDDQGEFLLAKRLPPGQYFARARRGNLPTILLQIRDYEQSKQTVVIAPGQEEVRLRFGLSSR
ncbi:MAG: carboxypeptidase regulatory-like domain-containing protein [Planctomycetota bacterium]